MEDGSFWSQSSKANTGVKNLEGEANFPENGVQKAVDTVQVLFDPYRSVALNKKIAPKIEEIRSLIRDAYIPNVRVLLCNNGVIWTGQAKNWIAEAKKDYGDKVDFIHFNHDSIVKILQRSKKVDTTLTLNGVLPGLAGESAYVMVRIYQLAETHKGFVKDITYATNSQNPVDLRDLRSNDAIQKQLEIGIDDLGYTYKRQREEGGGGSSIITSSIVAESVLAIWKQRPHQAKFRRKEHFGKLYEDIFRNLNAAQALLGVLIFRAVENERKRPTSPAPPDFMPYASHYISMLIGRKLLADMGVPLPEVSYRNFKVIVQKFEDGQAQYHANAVNDVRDALKACYGNREISLQQLSATFRRGDLLEMLGSHG